MKKTSIGTRRTRTKQEKRRLDRLGIPKSLRIGRAGAVQGRGSKTVVAPDATGRRVRFKSGDKVRFSDGRTGILGVCFKQYELLEPYARNRTFDACTLKHGSWVATTDMVRVAAKSGRRVRR